MEVLLGPWHGVLPVLSKAVCVCVCMQGNKRKLRVTAQPNVTLTMEHVPWHCRRAKVVLLGPLMPQVRQAVLRWAQQRCCQVSPMSPVRCHQSWCMILPLSVDSSWRCDCYAWQAAFLHSFPSYMLAR